MHKYFIMIFLLIALASFASAAENEAVEGSTLNLLFVQDSQGVEFHNDTMILKDAKPQVLYFSDRPYRLAGHMTRQEAVNTVSESFTNVPPNAVLVIFGEERSTDIVMTLTKAPKAEGEDLIFTGIKIIHGTPPEKGGTNALFIDTIRARRPGNPRGPADPRGPKDPRGPLDPR